MSAAAPSSDASPSSPVPPARPASLGALFWAFTRMALMGFGGVLPIAQRELVDRLRWLDNHEFAQMLSVGQVLPGPNVVNLSLMVGDRYFGLRGALSALAGMLTAPLILVIALAALYQRWAGVAAVSGALRGMGAVAAGLIIAMALKLLPALARNPMGRVACGVALVGAALAVGALRWPLAWVMLVGGSLCVGWAWYRLGVLARREAARVAEAASAAAPAEQAGA